MTSGLSALIDFRADFDLALPDPVGRVDDLALEVADVDDVEVDDADGPDPRRGEVEQGRRAEPAGADEQRLRAEQACLALDPDLRDQQVAAVALLLLGGQDDRCHELETCSLPALEPARHRGDVRVAHLGERLGREKRPNAAGAVQDHRRVAVWRDALDLLLDVRLRHVLGAGQVPLLPFRVLTDIDDGGGTHGEGVDLLRGDFSDLRAGLAEEVGVGLRHRVRGSDDRRAGSGFRARAVRGWIAGRCPR